MRLAFLLKKHAFLLIALCFFCAKSSCIDESDSDFLLTTQVNSLGRVLSEFDSCAEKSDYFGKWMRIRESVLDEQRIEFERGCAPNKANYIRCRAAHILASATVEIALSDCSPTEDLKHQISRFNASASAAVRIGANSP